MEFKKNDMVTLYIEDMGHDGEALDERRAIRFL